MSMECKKGCYPSKTRALEVLQKRQKENPTIVLRAYHCGSCGYWHLTSKPDRYAKDQDDLRSAS